VTAQRVTIRRSLKAIFEDFVPVNQQQREVKAELEKRTAEMQARIEHLQRTLQALINSRS
jgi:hypothetical protein